MTTIIQQVVEDKTKDIFQQMKNKRTDKEIEEARQSFLRGIASVGGDIDKWKKIVYKENQK